MREIVVESTWRERLGSLAGRRQDVWLVAGIVGAVVIGALALWSRGAPARIAPPAVAEASEALPEATGAPSAGPAGVIYVHVAGAVRTPGLYELPSGTRVAGAVEAAGGPTRKADLDALNLAEVLVDGSKIEVLVRGTAAPSIAAAPTVPALAGGTVVNLNLADQAALETIPGIGPVTATAILQYRDESGPFTAVEQLLDVSGIGPATLEEMRPYVTI